MLINAINYDPPLDSGIRRYVEELNMAGVETFESCQGGVGHCYAEPTIRFRGGQSEGFRALAIAHQCRFPVSALRRTWPIIDGEPTESCWELTFFSTAPPLGQRDFPLYFTNSQKGSLFVPEEMSPKNYKLLQTQIENYLEIIFTTSVAEGDEEKEEKKPSADPPN